LSLESSEKKFISKQELWNKSAAEIDSVRDRLGKEVDSGIRETIIALCALGFKTTGSCEGHLDHGLKGPWVDFGYYPPEISEKRRVAVRTNQPLDPQAERVISEISRELQEEQLQLISLLSEFYEHRNVPFDERIILEFHGQDRTRILSQGVEIQHARVSSEQEQKLQKYKKEMKEFTEFLTRKFFGS